MEQQKKDESLIFGRNPVAEALRSDAEIDAIFLCGNAQGSLVPIIASAKEKNIVIKHVHKAKLDSLCDGENHQNIAAIIAARKYSTIEEILDFAAQKNEPPFIVILDEIEDPHNLGAIIRTAECAGVHGIVIPKRRSATLSGHAEKASAGALQHIHVAKVTNLAREIDVLKERGVWIYGADMAGVDYKTAGLTGAVALVIGNEGKGISRLVKEKCDGLISIPMRGNINSLNASVAAGILLFSIGGL